MKLSVSDTNLRAVLSRFRTESGAQIEFDLSRDGLDIIANAEGWRTFARWCLVMAHPEMEDHADPEWLHAAYHLDYAFMDEERVAVVSKCGRHLRQLESHDVRLYRSRVIGDEFWNPED